LKTEIADLKEYVVEVAAAVDWHSAVVDVVTEPVSTTSNKNLSTYETFCKLRILKEGSFL
jgi:hypothetical protein